MALDKDEEFEVDGRIDVIGLESGFKYRVTGFKTFNGIKHYICKCLDTEEYVKVPVDDVDYHVDGISTVNY